MQRGVDEPFEIVVTDDGSTDHTAEVVERFAGTVDIPVRFVTQPHAGFHAARCRNNGAASSRAPYLIFFDGDCIFPHDHLQRHLRARRPGVARSGDSFRLNKDVVGRINDESIRCQAFVNWVPQPERRRMFWRWIKDELYAAVRHSRKPKVMAGNLAVWRRDFEHVNGFDEQYIGWGCEDDDLGQRLRRAGIRILPIFAYTQGYHVWHPSHPSRPTKWRDGANVEYLLRHDKPIRCRAGLSNHASGMSPDPVLDEGTSPRLPKLHDLAA
jgi:glycosyltransferase involved in cell wall biosynthesis